MTQLIIDLHQHEFNPSIEAESVEVSLGQLIANNGLKYRSVRLHGKIAYVEFGDSENAKRAVQELNDVIFMDFPISINFARGQRPGREPYMEKVDQGEKYQDRGIPRGRRSYRRNSSRNVPLYPQQHPPQQQQQFEQYPCRILIPTKMIKVVLGKGGSTIHEIQESTNTKIDVHREKNKGAEDTITTVKGNPKNFSDACQQIMNAISEEMQKTGQDEKPPQLKILAHDSLCGRLIGKNGANLKRIQEISGAKVVISNTMFEEFTPFPYSVEPLFSNERVLTVEGTLDSIHEAEKEISRKLRQCMERDMRTLMSNTPYPQGGMGLLNTVPYGHSGPGYGYMGQMPGMNPMFQGSPGILNGYPGAMASAGSPYQAPAGYYGPRSNVDEQVTISIPTRAVGAIIGKRGGHINNMKMYSQAQVRVIKGEEGGESKVEINGQPEAIWKASLCVFSKIKEGLRSSLYDAELKTELLVPGNCLGRIIGKKGSVVLSIQDGSGTEIEVPKDKQGGVKAPIYIKGTFSGTQAALGRIRGIVTRVQQQEIMK